MLYIFKFCLITLFLTIPAGWLILKFDIVDEKYFDMLGYATIYVVSVIIVLNIVICISKFFDCIHLDCKRDKNDRSEK